MMATAVCTGAESGNGVSFQTVLRLKRSIGTVAATEKFFLPLVLGVLV